MDKFIIGLVQSLVSENKEENIAAACNRIEEAARGGAQIICLQELFASRYFCSSENTDFFSLAEAICGPTVASMQRLAGKLKVALVVPIFERRAAGIYHNSAAVIDADGSLLGVYRKMHIPDDPLYYEKFYFTPGESRDETAGYKVFKTRYAKIGVLICWDQWYPEAARITSLLGAEILFYPTAIGWHPAEKDSKGPAQRAAWQTVQRGHSIANGVYLAATNRVGHEPTEGTDGIDFFGSSFVSSPFGELLAEAPADKEAVLTAICSRKYLESVRQLWPFYRDRRIDSYSLVANRWLEDSN